MRVGIDGYEANTDERVGIGQYSFQLLHKLAQLDNVNNYIIFLPQAPKSDLPKQNSHWKYVVGKPQSFWTIRQLPGLIAKNKLDMFFSPTHYGPWFTRIPQILSIMDLSYLHYPEMFRKKDLLQLKYMGWYSIKRAAKILTISEFTKLEIEKQYRKNGQNIIVTYPGLNPFLKKNPYSLKNKNILEQYGISHSYILFVGTLQPRKNINRLIEAFEKIAQKDLQLVLVGKKGWLYESIFEKIQTSKKKSLIKTLDFITDAHLPALYEQAECLVLPSLYEGFGIPVLEAMNFGCPVVVSKTSSLPEVAGEAGIYVDPENSKDIASGIMNALELRPEERRRRIKLGYEQVKKFTWENCARKTIDVFNSLKK